MTNPLLIPFVTDTQICHLHIFATPSPSHKLSPALLLFHGGGWKGGTPAQFYELCSYLSEQGITTVSAEYRFMDNARGWGPFECVSDAFRALQALHSLAGRLRLDREKIAVGGASAGGQLALCLCLMKKRSQDSMSPPRAFVGFNPVYDTRLPRFAALFSPTGDLLNPMHLARNCPLPPALALHGMDDKIVPVSDAKRFESVVAQAGGRLDLRTFPDCDHGFFNVDRASPQLLESIRLQVLEFLRRAMAI